MIKSKPCIVHNCSNPRFAKGYCKWHQILRTDKKPTGIKKVSEKRQGENKVYSTLRKVFLESHPTCQAQLPRCTGKANQIHHKKGKIGKLYLDIWHFLAICDNCHKWIELNPTLAQELGLSEKRLTT